jgi:PTS system mannose-specific IIA component
MIGLVLVTHGRLASEFITAMEHVVGPQERIEAICIGPEDDMEGRRNDIAEAIAQVDDGRGRDHPHRPVRRHARPTSPSR